MDQEREVRIRLTLEANEQAKAQAERGIKQTLDQVEKAAILKTMEAVGGNKSEAARRLGITRKTLHKKLKHYGVM